MTPNLVMTRGDVPSRPALVCLIEDNPMDVELTVQAFADSGFGNRIIPITGGQNALDYLFGRNEFADRETHPLPDLILLDLKLPEVDGHEVLRQIKSAPRLRRIPVVILTGSQEETDCIRSYDQHANSYLQKPFTYEGFCRIVAEVEDYWFTLNVAAPVEEE